MKFQNIFYGLSLVIAISTLFLACTLTTKKEKVPIFIESDDSIYRDVNSLVLTQEINVYGQEISSNGNISSQLNVDLINPQALPNDTLERNKINKQVAVLLKQLLKDPNEFDSYKVIFVNKTTDGDVTKSVSTGKIYNSKDLPNSIYVVSLGEKLDSSTSCPIGKTIFSNQDTEIITGLEYNHAPPYSQITLNIYKETDSGSSLVATKNIAQTLPGNNCTNTNLHVANFYKTIGLGSGNYQVEYLLNDSSVGRKNFNLR